MEATITVCAAWRPLVAYAISALLNGYSVVLCQPEHAENASRCAERSDVLVRCAPSTYCLPPFRACRHRDDSIPALFVSQGWVETQRAARQAGFSGYLGPLCNHVHLLDAVETVLHGGSFYHPGERIGRVVDALTERQVQVLALIGRGYTDQQIAQQLGIGETTVRHHLEILQGKLDTDRRGELAAMAALGGLCGEETDWKWVTVASRADGT